MSLVLDPKLVGRGAARTVAFAPYVLSGVAGGMLRLYIFDARYGLPATVLRAVGVDSPQWSTSKPRGPAMMIIVYL